MRSREPVGLYANGQVPQEIAKIRFFLEYSRPQALPGKEKNKLNTELSGSEPNPSFIPIGGKKYASMGLRLCRGHADRLKLRFRHG